MTAREALQNGDLKGALAALFDEVRAEPDKPRHRIFLFQLLSVTGDWDRALTQLNVARDLDQASGVMAQAYQEILQCEALRRQVFEGKRTPLVFGDPVPWIAQMIEALRLDSQGEAEQARDLRLQALEAAPAVPGKLTVRKAGVAPGGEDEAEAVEEASFEWLADGDSRLGPIIEMIVNGRYYWAPLERIAEVALDPPADLRDVVWTPAHFRWANQGEAVGVIPTRYVGSEMHEDDAVRLSRKTNWRETGPDSFAGEGQRVFMTDVAEYGIMDLRRIEFDVPAAESAPVEDDA